MATEAVDRFRELDAYRVAREWARFEGTPQRDLFRELRRRFLARHADSPGWVADLGSGPGRFSDALGPSSSPRLLLDISDLALRAARGRTPRVRRSRSHWSYARADLRHLPLRRARFGTVAALGNVLGFAGRDSDRILDGAAGLVAPGGSLLLEAVAGPGERARYLSRLPPGAVRRALVAPIGWVASKVEREGFAPESPRKLATSGAFRRFTSEELATRLEGLGFDVVERIAVAPALGPDPERIAAVRPDPVAWDGLLRLEERLGRSVERLGPAAAFLVAARRRSGPAVVPPEVQPAVRSDGVARTVARPRRRGAEPRTPTLK